MLYNVYSVLDVNVGYGVPIVQDNDAVAMRNFENGCTDTSSVWYTHPSDFSLMCIGSFDSSTGEISPCSIRKICSAFDFVARMKGVDHEF